MNRNLLVFAEYRDGEPLRVGLEILSKARELADERDFDLCALVLTDRVDDAEALSRYGADLICVCTDESFGHYGHGFIGTALDVVRELDPYAFIIGATALGSMLAPEVAAHLRTGLAAHVIDYRWDEDLIQVVPSFGGRIAAEIVTRTTPRMSTVKPGTFSMIERRGRGELKSVKVRKPEQDRIRFEGFERIEPKGRPIEDAGVVVVGGGGVESEKDWGMLKELAELLNGALGCTRPVADRSWSDEEHMVGTSGKIVKPAAYIGIGVSGSAHHTCGMKDSGIVIAINRDRNAPIFDTADLRVVADYRDVLPVLLTKLRDLKKRA